MSQAWRRRHVSSAAAPASHSAQVAGSGTASAVRACMVPVKLPLPLYTATMEWGPADSAEVVNEAVLPLRVTGLPVLAPSILNCTEPVSPLPLAGVTGAVKVTDWPTMGVALLEVTAVVVATPAHTHFILAREALQAGRHVFVEKPLAMSVAEVDVLAGLASEREVGLESGRMTGRGVKCRSAAATIRQRQSSSRRLVRR